MGRPILEYDSMTNGEILQLFKEQYEKIQPNDAIDYTKKCNVPSLYILKAKLNLTWNEALVSIGIKKKNLKFDRNRNYEEMFKEIINEIGYIPSVITLRKYCIENDKADITGGIVRKYGSYNKFLNKLRLQSANKTPTIIKETDEELLKMYKDFCTKLGRVATTIDLNNSDEIYNASVFSIRFGGFNNVRKLAGYKEFEKIKKKYTRYSLLKALKEEYVKKGGRLNQDELNKVCKNNPNLCSETTLLFYFKTTSYSEVWNEVEKEMIKDYIKLIKSA